MANGSGNANGLEVPRTQDATRHQIPRGYLCWKLCRAPNVLPYTQPPAPKSGSTPPKIPIPPTAVDDIITRGCDANGIGPVRAHQVVKATLG